MGIEEYRAEKKDNYLGADIVCPHCGKTYRKSAPFCCPECSVKIFDRDENGWAVLIDPKTVGKSRKYTVTLPSGETEEHFAGELVTVKYPFMTDSSITASADGIELRSDSSGGAYHSFRFLMPEHDVKVEISAYNSMSRPAPRTDGMTGMGGMMGMNGMTGQK